MENGFARGTPTATIELGEKSYTLGFTIGAMERVQDLGVLNVDASDEAAFVLALPKYVWACLDRESRKELSVDDIKELMNPRNIKSISEAVNELFKASMPEDSEGNAQPAAVKAPTAGRKKSTSTSSGELPATI